VEGGSEGPGGRGIHEANDLVAEAMLAYISPSKEGRGIHEANDLVAEPS